MLRNVDIRCPGYRYCATHELLQRIIKRRSKATHNNERLGSSGGDPGQVGGSGQEEDKG